MSRTCPYKLDSNLQFNLNPNPNMVQSNPNPNPNLLIITPDYSSVKRIMAT